MIKWFLVYGFKKVMNLLDIDAKTLGIIDVHVAMSLAKDLRFVQLKTQR